MASIPLTARAEAHPHLRALNILRDLPAVADLIELCFSNTMDSEGQRYVQDMRRAGRDDSFLRWATKMTETTSLPLTGYIWEENGKIVGNASLVPFRRKNERIYLIANVATHPDFRRRGIARALTERAYAEARKVLDHGGWTGLDHATIQAVRDGALPGDSLPALAAAPLIRDVTDSEAIIHGDGPARRVAVLFSYTPFPDIRFGHRFRVESPAENREPIWLMEEIETGALDRMMQDPLAPDDAGIIWTTWGD